MWADMALPPGTRAGHYEIIGPLGAGGMAEVYRARDVRLEREVAFKVLPEEFAADSGRVLRFEREARAISLLNHPNILAVFDVGSHEGRPYLVTELLEGDTLYQRLLHGPLPQRKAIDFAQQIARGLAAAHEKGVVHRDLKPENLFVSRDGILKILDFGLARIAPEVEAAKFAQRGPATEFGATVGTVGYMSPEQVRGEPSDHRSDIFSFGAVIYELIAGRRAFEGESMASVLSAVLRDEPLPLGASAPPGLETILLRCLRKRPEDRFAQMQEVRAALESLRTPTQAIPIHVARAEASIAVLPFVNLSADKENEYFSDGLAEEIINALTQVRGLKVTARTSAFAFRGEKQDIRKIAETLNVRTILEGSVRRAGNRVRVSAQLINAADGYHLWSERYDAEMADVFAVQDEISSAIAAALKLKLSAELGEARRHVPNLAAFEALLKGRHYQNDGTPQGLERSKEYFETAISLDPDYALAHAALAGYFWSLAANGLRPAHEVMEFARAETQKALELDPALPEARASLGVGVASYEYNWKEARRWFDLAMAGDSVSAMVRWCYAFYFLMPLGRLNEAVDELERALEGDPLNVGMRIGLINALHAAGLDSRAIREANKVLESDQNRWSAHIALARLYAFRRDYVAALAAAEKAYQLASWNSRVTAVLAAVLIRSGDRQRGCALIEKMQTQAGEKYGTPLSLAVFHAMCGETEAAADWFEKAVEQRDPAVIGYLRTPLMHELQSSARWPAIAKALNLSETV